MKFETIITQATETVQGLADKAKNGLAVAGLAAMTTLSASTLISAPAEARCNAATLSRCLTLMEEKPKVNFVDSFKNQQNGPDFKYFTEQAGWRIGEREISTPDNGISIKMDDNTKALEVDVQNTAGNVTVNIISKNSDGSVHVLVIHGNLIRKDYKLTINEKFQTLKK